jgi:hypothetical protein
VSDSASLPGRIIWYDALVPGRSTWYDALKADLSVPPETMVVANVFSESGASTSGKHVCVTYAALELATHAARDTIAGAIKDLVQRGYLVPETETIDGEQAYYDLVIPG